MDIRSECGSVAGAVLIEKAGETKRTLRVTLPVRVSLERGVRIMVDQGRPVTGYFVSCFHNGCMADQEGGMELVEQLKQGQTISLEGVDIANLPISVSLPLASFAKAYGGPPNEVRVQEERVLTQKEFEQTKRAEEARKLRCESGPPVP
jgi:invasion protein IalB